MGEAGVRIVVLAALVALAGCTSKYLPVDDAGRHTAAPPVEPSAAAATPPAPTAPPDTCGAADLAYLVGKPKTEIPIPVDLTKRRVTCESCPRTMEVRPDRQTILFDDATKLVKSVTCG